MIRRDVGHRPDADAGSWIVGDEAGDLGIREDDDRITQNTRCFVPHVFR